MLYTICKKCLVLVLFAAAFAAAAAGRYNVRDYGAVGDGVADDTAAIQQAFNAAADHQSYVMVGQMGGFWGGWGGDGVFGEVYFPAGEYRISRTLVFPHENSEARKLAVTGEPGAVIVQSDSARDILYLNRIMRLFLKNLEFRGGATQLQLWTENYDMTTIFVDRCRFEDAGEAAVRCRTPADDDGRLVPPWQVSWRGGVPELSANPPGSWEFWNSTLLDIENSDFRNCRKVLDVSCDLTVLRDSTLTAPADQAGAVFELKNLVFLERVKGYGSGGSAAEHPYWIDLSVTCEGKAMLFVDDCEFDTAGPGWCLVRSDVLPGYISSAIRIADSRIRSAGSPENAVVCLAEGTHPNLLSIRGVSDPSGEPVKAVAYGRPLSREDFSESIRYYKHLDSKASFRFGVSGCSPNIDMEMTPAAYEWNQQPIPEEVRTAARVDAVEFSFGDPAAAFPTVIHAADFGVGGAGDQSDALERLFAFAAERAPATVVFEPAALELSRTVMVPNRLRLTGTGSNLFVMAPDCDCPIFRVDGNRMNVFENLGFVNGSAAVAISAAPDGEYLFDHCTFYDQGEAAVSAWKSGEEDDARLRITRSRFITMRALSGDLAHKELDTSWVNPDTRLQEAGFVDNAGGALFAHHLLGVPILPRTRIENGRQDSGLYPPDCGWGDNLRWFDNGGRLYALGNRLGGEFCGMSPVHNTAAAGSVYLAEGFSYHGNLYVRKEVVFCEEMPALLVVEDLSCGAEALDSGHAAGIARRLPDGGEADIDSGEGVYVSGLLMHSPPNRLGN